MSSSPLIDVVCLVQTGETIATHQHVYVLTFVDIKNEGIDSFVTKFIQREEKIKIVQMQGDRETREAHMRLLTNPDFYENDIVLKTKLQSSTFSLPSHLNQIYNIKAILYA